MTLRTAMMGRVFSSLSIFVIIIISQMISCHDVYRRQASDQFPANRPISRQDIPVFDIYQPQSNAETVSDMEASARRDMTYPSLTRPIKTNFTCRGVKGPGWYADVETGCQQYHRCYSENRETKFICPPGTLFSQETLICDFFYNVNCSEAHGLYEYANSRLYRIGVPLHGNANWTAVEILRQQELAQRSSAAAARTTHATAPPKPTTTASKSTRQKTTATTTTHSTVPTTKKAVPTTTKAAPPKVAIFAVRKSSPRPVTTTTSIPIIKLGHFYIFNGSTTEDIQILEDLLQNNVAPKPVDELLHQYTRIIIILVPQSLTISQQQDLARLNPQLIETDRVSSVGDFYRLNRGPGPLLVLEQEADAGISYPIANQTFATNFTCAGKTANLWYSDPESRCQQYHYCDDNGADTPGICPVGTLFSQQILTCTPWSDVVCEEVATPTTTEISSSTDAEVPVTTGDQESSPPSISEIPAVSSTPPITTKTPGKSVIASIQIISVFNGDSPTTALRPVSWHPEVVTFVPASHARTTTTTTASSTSLGHPAGGTVGVEDIVKFGDLTQTSEAAILLRRRTTAATPSVAVSSDENTVEPEPITESPSESPLPAANGSASLSVVNLPGIAEVSSTTEIASEESSTDTTTASTGTTATNTRTRRRRTTTTSTASPPSAQNPAVNGIGVNGSVNGGGNSMTIRIIPGRSNLPSGNLLPTAVGTTTSATTVTTNTNKASSKAGKVTWWTPALPVKGSRRTTTAATTTGTSIVDEVTETETTEAETEVPETTPDTTDAEYDDTTESIETDTATVPAETVSTRRRRTTTAKAVTVPTESTTFQPLLVEAQANTTGVNGSVNGNRNSMTIIILPGGSSLGGGGLPQVAVAGAATSTTTAVTTSVRTAPTRSGKVTWWTPPLPVTAPPRTTTSSPMNAAIGVILLETSSTKESTTASRTRRRRTTTESTLASTEASTEAVPTNLENRLFVINESSLSTSTLPDSTTPTTTSTQWEPTGVVTYVTRRRRTRTTPPVSTTTTADAAALASSPWIIFGGHTRATSEPQSVPATTTTSFAPIVVSVESSNSSFSVTTTMEPRTESTSGARISVGGDSSIFMQFGSSNAENSSEVSGVMVPTVTVSKVPTTSPSTTTTLIAKADTTQAVRTEETTSSTTTIEPVVVPEETSTVTETSPTTTTSTTTSAATSTTTPASTSTTTIGNPSDSIGTLNITSLTSNPNKNVTSEDQRINGNLVAGASLSAVGALAASGRNSTTVGGLSNNSILLGPVVVVSTTTSTTTILAGRTAPRRAANVTWWTPATTSTETYSRRARTTTTVAPRNVANNSSAVVEVVLPNESTTAASTIWSRRRRTTTTAAMSPGQNFTIAFIAVSATEAIPSVTRRRRTTTTSPVTAIPPAATVSATLVTVANNFLDIFGGDFKATSEPSAETTRTTVSLAHVVLSAASRNKSVPLVPPPVIVNITATRSDGTVNRTLLQTGNQPVAPVAVNITAIGPSGSSKQARILVGGSSSIFMQSSSSNGTNSSDLGMLLGSNVPVVITATPTIPASAISTAAPESFATLNITSLTSQLNKNATSEDQTINGNVAAGATLLAVGALVASGRNSSAVGNQSNISILAAPLVAATTTTVPARTAPRRSAKVTWWTPATNASETYSRRTRATTAAPNSDATNSSAILLGALPNEVTTPATTLWSRRRRTTVATTSSSSGQLNLTRAFNITIILPSIVGNATNGTSAALLPRPPPPKSATTATAVPPVTSTNSSGGAFIAAIAVPSGALNAFQNRSGVLMVDHPFNATVPVSVSNGSVVIGQNVAVPSTEPLITEENIMVLNSTVNGSRVLANIPVARGTVVPLRGNGQGSLVKFGYRPPTTTVTSTTTTTSIFPSTAVAANISSAAGGAFGAQSSGALVGFKGQRQSSQQILRTEVVSLDNGTIPSGITFLGDFPSLNSALASIRTGQTGLLVGTAPDMLAAHNASLSANVTEAPGSANLDGYVTKRYLQNNLIVRIRPFNITTPGLSETTTASSGIGRGFRQLRRLE